MRNGKHRVIQLGELVAAVFDSAARYSADPRVVSQLSARALAHLLSGASGQAARTPALVRP
jgi:hypothetical protein